jgi:hypothetical protein
MAFAPPPSPDLQGFNVQPVPYTDPLQTLAQMRQLRTQGLQQQTASLQLQQEQMAVKSTQGLMKAYQEAAGDPVKMATLAPKYGVMPDHMLKIQQMLDEQANKRAQTRLFGSQADKDATEAQDRRHDALNEAYTPVFEEKDPAKQQVLLGQINQNLINQGYDVTKDLIPPNSTPDAIQQAKHAYTTLNYIKAKAEEAEKKAQQARSEAETKKLGLESEGLERQRAIAEIQIAPKDPKTGGPTPAAMADLKKQFPNVRFPPGTMTKESLDEFVRSGVATEKQPEYDINAMMARIGQMGKDKWDQFLVRYAQGIGKTPATLEAKEFEGALSKYAELTQDPTLRLLAIGQKGLQEQLTRAQLTSIPDKTDIDLMARQLINGDLSPSELSEFRTRNANAATQVLRRADEMVKAEGNPLFPGRPFSFADLQTAYEKRKKTEIDFDAGGEGAKLVRAFGNSIQHTALLDDARKALFQSDIPALRRIAGILGTAIGGTAATTYDFIADFVSDEVAKAFIAGGGGQGERQSKRENFDRGKGDKQISDNIKALMHLLDSQRQGLEDQYARGTSGKGLSTGKLFPPATLAARDRLMGRTPASKTPSGGKIIVIDASGKPHPFDTEQQAKDFENLVRQAGGTTRRQ